MFATAKVCKLTVSFGEIDPIYPIYSSQELDWEELEYTTHQSLLPKGRLASVGCICRAPRYPWCWNLWKAWMDSFREAGQPTPSLLTPRSRQLWKKNPEIAWLVGLYRGWYTTQLYRDYNKPLWGSLLTNQDFMETTPCVVEKCVDWNKLRITQLNIKLRQLFEESYERNLMIRIPWNRCLVHEKDLISIGWWLHI